MKLRLGIFVMACLLAAGTAGAQQIYTFDCNAEGWASANVNSPVSITADGSTLDFTFGAPVDPNPFDPFINKTGLSYDGDTLNQLAFQITMTNGPAEGVPIGAFFFPEAGGIINYDLGTLNNGSTIVRADLTVGADNDVTAGGGTYSGNITQMRLDLPNGSDYPSMQNASISIDWIAVTDNATFEPTTQDTANCDIGGNYAELDVFKVDTAPVIDGTIDVDEYPPETLIMDAESVAFAGGSLSGDPASATVSGVYYLAWDDDNLYIAADITDDDVQFLGDQGGPLNITDIMQFCTDHNYLQAGGTQTPGIHIHDVAPGQASDNSTPAYWQHWPDEGGGVNEIGYPDSFPNAQWDASITAGGYQCELALPWTDFTLGGTINPAINTKLGYLALLVDFDAGALTDLWTNSSAGLGGIGDASTWNTMTLKGTVDDPEGNANISRSVTAVLGQVLCLTATDVGTAGPGDFTWTYTPVGGSLQALAETGPEYCIGAVTEADSGTYVVSFEDGAKIARTQTFVVSVVDQLPAAGLMGLGALALGLAGAAAFTVSRKRRK